MEDFNYRICSEQLGKGINDKIFIVQEINNPSSFLVAKIYDDKHIFNYKKEQNVLNTISEGEYLIKLKDNEVI